MNPCIWLERVLQKKGCFSSRALLGDLEDLIVVVAASMGNRLYSLIFSHQGQESCRRGCRVHGRVDNQLIGVLIILQGIDRLTRFEQPLKTLVVEHELGVGVLEQFYILFEGFLHV